MKISNIILSISLLSLVMACNEKEESITPYQPPKEMKMTHPNDVYNYEHLTLPYQAAVRWRWDDRFVKPSEIATPIREDLVIPVTKLIDYLWIGIYESQGDKGKKFMKELFPAELQYIGTYIYRDGAQVQGYAEGGARITLLNLNGYNLQNKDWLTKSGEGVLATIHHEFSHLVHQNYGLPPGFASVSDKYLGNGWRNLLSDFHAISLGMTSKYATLNENEDFCELISHYLTMSEEAFNKAYITQEDCSKSFSPQAEVFCKEKNEGRLLIKKKLDIVLAYYKINFGLDLKAVRDELQTRLEYVQKHNKIP